MIGSDGYRSWKNWNEQSFGVFGRADDRYFECEFRAAGINYDTAKTLLELGFGNGKLAVWATAHGWSYVGTEIDPELVERARGHGFEVSLAHVPLTTIAQGRHFDIIAAFDVLEHLTASEITSVLGDVYELLKPGGIFIARFPSGDSPFSRAIQFGDLTHQTILGSGAVQQLAVATGFKVVQIRSPVLPVLGLGLVRGLRRCFVRLTRALISWLLRLTYFDNQPRVVDPNMLIVLKRSE